MAASIIISNPLLLLPQERAEIIRVQVWQFQQTSVGIILANQAAFFANGWPEDIRIHYGQAWFALLALLGLLIGITRPETRRRSAWILAWTIPLTYVILTFGTRRTHYFIPVALPLFSSLVNLFPIENPEPLAKKILANWVQKSIPWILGLAILLQAALYIRSDVSIYSGMLTRETSAPGIAFYQEIDQEVLSVMPSDLPITVYRDWHIYFPGGAGRRVEMDWNYATRETIQDLDPDLVLLEKENLELFGDPDVVAQAVDPDRMALVHEFYADAMANRLNGFRLVYQNGFAAAYLSEPLYDQYFTSH
jgi:hypothetical protein